jgi:hypothetical protein
MFFEWWGPHYSEHPGGPRPFFGNRLTSFEFTRVGKTEEDHTCRDPVIADTPGGQRRRQPISNCKQLALCSCIGRRQRGARRQERQLVFCGLLYVINKQEFHGDLRRLQTKTKLLFKSLR